jgi:aminoglycoside phosphotransferase (APT) family kinase protein
VVSWLATQAPELALGEDAEATILSGGRSNLTYAIRDSSRCVVVRRPPLAHVLETAHDVAREYRVMRALERSDVPVPRMVALCDDTQVIGAPFLVMEWVDGVVRRSPEDFAGMRAELARESSREVARTLAAVHAIDIPRHGLEQHGRGAGYLTRQLDRWQRQWDSSAGREVPAVEELARRLRERCPVRSEVTLVHGDFRYDNLIFAGESSPALAAVVDWELSTLGDPLADLGFLIMSWSDTGGPVLDGGVVAGPGLGFPTAAELAALYQDASGRSLEQLDFYVALAHYKTAVIFEGIHARHLAGATVGSGFEHAGDRVLALSEAGLAELGGDR